MAEYKCTIFRFVFEKTKLYNFPSSQRCSLATKCIHFLRFLKFALVAFILEYLEQENGREGRGETCSKRPWNLIGMSWIFLCRAATLINNERHVLFLQSGESATCKTQQGFHHANLCVSHLFQTFNASPPPGGSVFITKRQG